MDGAAACQGRRAAAPPNLLVKDDSHLSMDASRQHTLVRTVAVGGFGYWSGQDVELEFRPAAAGTGTVFVRRDLPGCPRIPASIAQRYETPRRSSLRSGDAGVEMVEHVLAALAGVGVDNCEIWTDAAEMPGCDGSAQPFVEAFDSVGLEEQDAPRPRHVIQETLRLGDAEAWIEASPADRPVFRYELDYGSASIGRQQYETELTPETFRRELAACRTFMLKAEAEWLLAQGIGSRATAQDLLVYGPSGPIDNRERFSNECARHKLLDMVGDLALAQRVLVGRITAHRSGHRLNAELVRRLLQNAHAAACRRCA